LGDRCQGLEEGFGLSDAAEVLKRNRDLLRAHKDSEESEQLLAKLPQGHGSGLNADTVDGLHAAEIIAKAPGKGGGGGGSGSGSADMTKAVYDQNDNGVVDNSEKFDGKTVAQVQDHAPQTHGNEVHSPAFLSVEVDPSVDSTVKNKTLTQIQDHAPQEHADEAHSIAYATATELADHAALPDVHHAQSHTLGSHSTKAHSELTGVTANQHHNQTHGDADHSETYEKTSAKGAGSGYCGLGTDQKVASANMKTITVTKTFAFHVPDALTTGQKKYRILADCACTIVEVRLVVDTAPVGAAIIVDVHTGTGVGTTIFTTQANRPTISDGSKTGVNPNPPEVTGLAKNDEISVYVDQIGSGTAGSDLTIEVICSQVAALS